MDRERAGNGISRIAGGVVLFILMLVSDLTYGLIKWEQTPGGILTVILYLLNWVPPVYLIAGGAYLLGSEYRLDQKMGSQRLFWVADAVDYAIYGTWGWGRPDVDPEDVNNRVAKFLARLRQAAANGEIVIRGKRSHRAAEEDIPSDHWRFSHIDPREWRPDRLDKNWRTSAVDVRHPSDAPFYWLRMRRGDAERLAQGL